MPATSWVIIETATGRVVCETWSRRTAEAINAARYHAVPIAEHLAGLSARPT